MNQPTASLLRNLMIILLACAALLAAASLGAAPLTDVPQVLEQPDGRVIHALASGDEFYNWIHDERGYVIVLDEDGWWVWAKRLDGRIVPTVFRVGDVDPSEAGLAPRILPDSQELRERRRWLEESPDPPGIPEQIPDSFSAINNIVVFIRFSDETEFGNQISLYEQRFNDTSAGAISMKSYFQAVSYNALAIDSHFFPNPTTMVVSYQHNQPRNYYRPYHATTNPTGYQGGANGSERRVREHALLRDAVNAISAQVPTGLDLDNNGDGRVDNVCFIIRGGPDGWADLLWPHRWMLSTYDVRIHGKRVWDYNFNLQSWIDVSVLAHEMFHSLGAPDLYHYDSAYQHLQPVWRWDIMESTTNPPQHMGAHMKIRYGGWLSAAPVITAPGAYTLNPLTSPTNNVFRINSSHSGQYYILEYRQKTASGYESAIPGTGLLVYRIDSSRQGNASGPPDEVYVYRPNGTPTVNGSPGSAHFSAGVGRTQINASTNPSGFLQDGTPGGLSLSGVTAAGATISFTVDGINVQRTGNGTVTSTPAGINCGATCARLFQYGTSVSLTATPAAGQQFAGWGGACSGAGPCSVNILGAHTVTALFQPIPTNYTLTVSRLGTGSGSVTSDPEGIDCGTACQAGYPQGTLVTLSQEPAADSVFAGWGGACAGTGACTVNMSQARSVTATFDLAPTNPQPGGLAVDELPGGGAAGNLNGILEPGETVAVAPTWRNPGPDAVAVTGNASGLSGPGNGYALVDTVADYGIIPAGGTANCGDATGNCYQVSLAVPATRPALHWDLTFTETLSTGEVKIWTIHVGDSFADVGVGHWAYHFIETLLHSGITAGCGGFDYCPTASINRWQMAVFLAKALIGDEALLPDTGTVPGMGDYACGAGGTSVFGDILPTDPACRHIHYTAAEEVTAGCGGGLYCPTQQVTRWQMGVFLAKAMVGDESLIPASGVVPGMGSYSCGIGNASVFADVSPGDPACRHIHYIAAEGVTAGCGGGLYCPAHDLSRDQMAVFLAKAFELTLE